MGAVIVLRVSSRWGTAKREARRVVHLWRGRLAAAAVAAVATDAVLRRGSGEAAEREMIGKAGVEGGKDNTALRSLCKLRKLTC